MLLSISCLIAAEICRHSIEGNFIQYVTDWSRWQSFTNFGGKSRTHQFWNCKRFQRNHQWCFVEWQTCWKLEYNGIFIWKWIKIEWTTRTHWTGSGHIECDWTSNHRHLTQWTSDFWREIWHTAKWNPRYIHKSKWMGQSQYLSCALLEIVVCSSTFHFVLGLHCSEQLQFGTILASCWPTNHFICSKRDSSQKRQFNCDRWTTKSAIGWPIDIQQPTNSKKVTTTNGSFIWKLWHSKVHAFSEWLISIGHVDVLMSLSIIERHTIQLIKRAE